MNYNVDENGYYGRFGGAYIPEILHANVEQLQREYLRIMDDPAFQKEFHDLLTDYVGRPSPLTYAPRMSQRYGTRIYLKREDLNHTGAHKINNTIGQILIARRCGKTRIVAEFRDTVGCGTPPGRRNHATAHPNQYLDRGRYDRRRTSRYVQMNVQSAITGTAVSVEENSGRSHSTNSVRIMMCAR